MQRPLLAWYNQCVSEENRSRNYSVEILTDPKTDRIVGERWCDQEGRFDRPNDLPAYVDYCPDKGTVTYARWHKDGQLHRGDDQPATLVRNPLTQAVTHEQYAILDQFHRDNDQPAYIIRDDAGRLLERSFYRYGELHRETGPAVERFDPESGLLIEAEYWRNDRQQPSPSDAPAAEPTFG